MTHLGRHARWKRLVHEEDGPTTTEYAVMFAMILIVIFATVQMHGRTVYDLFSDVNDQVNW